MQKAYVDDTSVQGEPKQAQQNVQHAPNLPFRDSESLLHWDGTRTSTRSQKTC